MSIINVLTTEQKLDILHANNSVMAKAIQTLLNDMGAMSHQLYLLTEIAETSPDYDYHYYKLQSLDKFKAKYFAVANGDTGLFDEVHADAKKLYKEANEKGGRALEGYNAGVTEFGEWKKTEVAAQQTLEVVGSDIIKI